MLERAKMQVSDLSEIYSIVIEGEDFEMATTKELDSRMLKVEAALGLRETAFTTLRRELWEKFKLNRVWIIPVIAIATAAVGWWANNAIKIHHEAVIADFNQKVDSRISGLLSAPGGVNEKLTKIDATANKIDASLETLKPFIQELINHQFENISKLPTQTLLQRLPAINNLVAVAQNQDVKITPKLVGETGARLVAASDKYAIAWDTAVAFVNYRSSLNKLSASGFYPLNYPENSGVKTYYVWGIVHGKPRAEFTTSIKRVPIAISARYELIASPVKQVAEEGPETLLGIGGDLGLDGFYLRNIVLKDVTIHYNGGPLHLDNVTFINCKFVINNVNSGRGLGSQILADSKITFTASDVLGATHS
jgi:hypothetical protein